MLPKPVTLALAAILYGGVALTANAAGAGALTERQIAEIAGMRAGDMEKLVLHDAPRPRLTTSFRDEYGNSVEIADFGGRIVVLNFWATWCPPCRAEMPSLDRLSAAVARDEIEVVTLSTDRGGPEVVREFFDDNRIENLEIYNDRANKLPRQAAILGLPVTLILDRQGREIGRVTGDAEWDSASALAILRRIAELTAEGTSAEAPRDTDVAEAAK